METTKGETTKKTVAFQLLPLTEDKKAQLEKMAENFRLIYNLAAIRLPSLQSTNQSKFRPILNSWRKEWNDKIIIHSKIADEAIECARANYVTIVTQGENTNPTLSAPIIRLHNQIWCFEHHNGRTYVTIPGENVGSRYKKLRLPIKNSEYCNRILADNRKFGVGQVDLKRNRFITTIEVPVKPSGYIPETFIGVDMGIKNLVVAVAIDSDLTFQESKFWSGREVRHIRASFDNYAREVSRINRRDLVVDAGRYEHNWMKNINHNISRGIIEMAKKYPHPVILMEDLHRFINTKWNFFQLRQMIEYKASMEGIRTVTVSPAYTSQTCPKCGHISRNNRYGLHFRCQSCGYQNNADFVGALNIARSNIAG